LRWIGVCGVVALITVTSLMPAKWQLLRTGHWQVEHFLAYFAATSIVCLAWGRSSMAVGLLILFAALLEVLQGLTSDRVPDLPTALSGAGGVLAAALLAEFIIRVRNRRVSAKQQATSRRREAVIPAVRFFLP
jgi:hypothetical protein